MPLTSPPGREHVDDNLEPRARAPFPADPGTHQCARSRAARDRPPGDRPSRTGVRRTRPTCLEGLQEIFQTAGPVVIYPASGTGAWEAALVNTLSPGRCRLDGPAPAGSPCCGTTWRGGWGWSRSSWTPTGAAAPIRPRSAPCSRTTGRTASRRSAWCTTRPRPAASPMSIRCGV